MDIDSAHQSQQIPLVAVEDVVGTRDNGLVLRGGSLYVGIGQPLNIQVVADKEAAYGVGDAGDDLVLKSADIVAALSGTSSLVLKRDFFHHFRTFLPILLCTTYSFATFGQTVSMWPGTVCGRFCGQQRSPALAGALHRQGRRAFFMSLNIATRLF